MTNQFKELDNSRKWNMLVVAATRVLRDGGLAPKRVPGRGRSNTWEVEENGQRKRVSIRTTTDREFAFQPLEKGAKWKVLDDVDLVIVAAVDNRDDPRNVEVFRFDAEEVRKRFDASYAARIGAGQTVRDDFGMWLHLDEGRPGRPVSVGTGLATACPPIAIFPLEPVAPPEDGDAGAGEATDDGASEATGDGASEATALEPHTVAEVLESARRHIATLAGVRREAVKLNCQIETCEGTAGSPAANLRRS